MATTLYAPPSAAAAESPKTRVSPQREELRALTGLRFWAAFSVVVYHFTEPLLQHWPKPLVHLASSGYVAVSLFFLLSGFVLSYSYLGREGAVRGTARSFWVARFARIYPAYFIAFLLAMPTNLLWSIHVNAVKIAAAKLLLGGVTVLSMVQAWTPWTAWYWNFPAWSISVEAFFYFSFPFLAKRLGRLGSTACLKLMLLCYGLALIAPTALYFTKHVSGPPDVGRHLQMAVEFTPLLRLPEFIIGMLLGRLYVLGHRWSLNVSRLLSYLSLASILATLAFGPSIPHSVLSNGLLAPLFAVLIYALAAGEGFLAKFLSLGFIVLLGEASYGVYILQIPLSYLLHTLPPIQTWETFALYTAVLITASLFSLRYVETPLRKRIRKWLG